MLIINFLVFPAALVVVSVIDVYWCFN